MAVPFLDAVTDFCDDTEEHLHNPGNFAFAVFQFSIFMVIIFLDDKGPPPWSMIQVNHVTNLPLLWPLSIFNFFLPQMKFNFKLSILKS